LVIKGNAESLMNICGASGRISALLWLARESCFCASTHRRMKRPNSPTELHEGLARQLSDAELMRIAPGGRTAGAAAQLPSLLMLHLR
jgi:hypothetical protein